jgi:shikimate dehydrogenase
MHPSGETRLFPILGDPIGQVRSPEAITRILGDRGADAMVVPMHVRPPDFDRVVDALERTANVGGLLVTVPHKRAAAARCATTTDRAAFLGAVNVMRRGAGGWHGDATDGQGFLDGIARQGWEVRGRRALLVGCGGAGAAIALEMLLRGVSGLALHDADAGRRDDLLRRLERRFPGKVSVGGRDPAGFDLVANATPLGMRPGDDAPVELGRLAPDQFVACVVTRPEVTPLVAAARRIGCRTMTGIGMFEAQAESLATFLLGGAAPSAPAGTGGTQGDAQRRFAS